MNGLDVFKRYAAADGELRKIKERIKRRRALAEGCTSRPPSPDGGSRSSTDASMRLLDYMSDIEQLQAELEERSAQRERDRACCVYLADMLPTNLGSLMLLRYIEGKSVQACATASAYSVTHTRRLLREAEDICRRMELTLWDGNHIPIVAMTQGPTDMQPEPENMAHDGS